LTPDASNDDVQSVCHSPMMAIITAPLDHERMHASVMKHDLSMHFHCSHF